MIDLALSSFAGRDADLAEQLPDKDNVLDRLNRGLLDELKQYASDEESSTGRPISCWWPAPSSASGITRSISASRSRFS